MADNFLDCSEGDKGPQENLELPSIIGLVSDTCFRKPHSHLFDCVIFPFKICEVLPDNLYQ
jgi:hypothetical protein